MLAQGAQASYQEAGYTVDADPKRQGECGASNDLKATSSQNPGVL
jgi:hypothetical protein